MNLAFQLSDTSTGLCCGDVCRQSTRINLISAILFALSVTVFNFIINMKCNFSCEKFVWYFTWVIAALCRNLSLFRILGTHASWMQWYSYCFLLSCRMSSFATVSITICKVIIVRLWKMLHIFRFSGTIWTLAFLLWQGITAASDIQAANFVH